MHVDYKVVYHVFVDQHHIQLTIASAYLLVHVSTRLLALQDKLLECKVNFDAEAPVNKHTLV